jgi:hypothetical protein
MKYYYYDLVFALTSSGAQSHFSDSLKFRLRLNTVSSLVIRFKIETEYYSIHYLNTIENVINYCGDIKSALKDIDEKHKQICRVNYKHE